MLEGPLPISDPYTKRLKKRAISHIIIEKPLIIPK
jgi:hypothetical protein